MFDEVDHGVAAFTIFDLTYAATTETGIFVPLAIFSMALLIVSCVLRGEMWRTRVALDTVWQRLYLFSIINLARKMASERMRLSCADTAHQGVVSLISRMNCNVWNPSAASVTGTTPKSHSNGDTSSLQEPKTSPPGGAPF
jgi:hypothetical protein